MEVSKEELTKAFEIWINDRKQNPDNYMQDGEATSEDHAEYLIELLNELK